MNDFRRMARDRAMRGGRGRRSMRSGRDYAGVYHGEIEGRYGTDGRRGVKGTGRYGIGGSRYYGRDREMYDDDYCHEDDYDDYEYDYARGERRSMRRDRRMDYESEESAHLSKRDVQEWKRHLENADGSLGEHFSGEQVKSMAEKLGIRYKGYDEKELCMTVNMLYSDYCEALRGVIPPEKELMVYTKMAKAFLDDDDFDGDGSEKLALYYYAIADSED